MWLKLINLRSFTFKRKIISRNQTIQKFKLYKESDLFPQKQGEEPVEIKNPVVLATEYKLKHLTERIVNQDEDIDTDEEILI